MNRIFFLACIISGLAVGSATAEDYLLRLDAIGIEQTPSDAKPEESVLHSIEVLARPNIPFHAKVQIQKETLIMSGQLEPADADGFTLAIQYRRTFDTGIMVPIAVNQLVAVPDETVLRTSIGIKLGESVTLGDITTKNDRASETTGKITLRRSRIRYGLTLTKYQPPKN